jgi:hypothetical protein
VGSQRTTEAVEDGSRGRTRSGYPLFSKHLRSDNWLKSLANQACSGVAWFNSY